MIEGYLEQPTGWRNEYGSVMTLAADGQRLRGIYRSSTGSSGAYLIRGWIDRPRPSAPGTGLALGFTLSWRSIDGGQADPSWHFASAFAGQILVDEAGPALHLSHILVAPRPFPGLCGSGSFIDKLIFRPASVMPMAALPLFRARTERLAFASDDPPIRYDLHVETIADWNIGIVTGAVHHHGEASEVLGCADITEGGTEASALALCWLDEYHPGIIAIAGSCDRASGAVDAVAMRSCGTLAADRYLQTTISPCRLVALEV